MKFSLILPTVLLIFSTTSYGENSSECKHRIILLPQAHANVLGGRLQVAPEDLDEIARSQFSIAKYLERHNSIPVFSEQVSSDITMQAISADFRKFIEKTKSMFPNGLPHGFESLNPEQKTILARAGGDAISFILNNTKVLHRVVENDQIQDELIDKVSTWYKNNPNATTVPYEILYIIFNVRENLALDQINNYFKSNPSQRDIILIYGYNHSDSFRTHQDKFPGNCILTPYGFQSAEHDKYHTHQNHRNVAQ